MGHAAEHAGHGPGYYVKIWGILLVLLVISIVGPMAEIRWLTLVTAFGIAVVKALMVAAYFMHLNIEKRYIWYMLISMLAMVGLFWFGTAADVWKKDGRNWTNPSAIQYIEQDSKAVDFHHGTKHP